MFVSRAAKRPSRMETSPATTSKRSFIVTTMPFRMRSEDIGREGTATPVEQEAGEESSTGAEEAAPRVLRVHNRGDAAASEPGPSYVSRTSLGGSHFIDSSAASR